MKNGFKNFKGKKAFVTGTTGFVGSAVARELLDAGAEVMALVRPGSDRSNLSDLDVTQVKGDLSSFENLCRAMDGADLVFHVAADYRLWVPDPEPMYQANVKGTENVMRAATKVGVERAVYTSSVAVLGLPGNGEPSDENTPSTVDDMIGHYKRSKFLAEEVVRTMARSTDLPVVIVNPSTPIGPYDVKPTPTGRIILDALDGNMPAYVDTGLNVAHVDDVARGHLLAVENGRVGERYILGGEDMSLKSILETVSSITGRRDFRVRLPHRLVLPIAYISEAVARVTGKEPRATVDGVRMSMKHMYFSTDKARDELGYEPRPALEAIAEAVQWFLENDYSSK